MFLQPTAIAVGPDNLPFPPATSPGGCEVAEMASVGASVSAVKVRFAAAEFMRVKPREGRCLYNPLR